MSVFPPCAPVPPHGHTKTTSNPEQKQPLAPERDHKAGKTQSTGVIRLHFALSSYERGKVEGFVSMQSYVFQVEF